MASESESVLRVARSCRHTLQRVVAQPEAHGYTTDNRLVLLAKQNLWIITGDFSAAADLNLGIQAVQLAEEPARGSLIEAHNL
jgi:hypothetical protein